MNDWSAKNVELMENVERDHPGVRFARYPDDETIDAGKFAEWGTCPVSITGTLHGNPFYYFHSEGTSRLSVWDGARLGSNPESVPNHHIEPILFSSVNADEDGNVFSVLLKTLHKPADNELHGNVTSAMLAKFGLPDTKAVESVLNALAPSVSVVQREESFMHVEEIFLTSPDGIHLQLSWPVARFFKSEMTVNLYYPSDDLFVGSSSAVYGLIGLESLTANGVASTLVDRFDEIEWDFDGSFVGHTMVFDKYVLSQRTSIADNVDFPAYRDEVGAMIDSFAKVFSARSLLAV